VMEQRCDTVVDGGIHKSAVDRFRLGPRRGTTKDCGETLSRWRETRLTHDVKGTADYASAARKSTRRAGGCFKSATMNSR
jgi:hypothetical protein